LAKTSFDENLALELYHTCISDSAIAKGVGTLTVTIRGWRRRKGLKNISPGARPMAKHTSACRGGGAPGGVDYRTALNQEQSKEMGQFLRTLSWAAGKAKESGVKPNVDIFMRSWIGLPISAEGKRQQLRNQQEEYRKRQVARV